MTLFPLRGFLNYFLYKVLTGLAELCFCLLPTNFLRFSVLSRLHILCSESGRGGGGDSSSSNMGSLCMVEVVLS
jgi:hypothetical protein